MGKHIIDTEIKVSTCNRCKDIVFACTVGGLKAMADPKPIKDLDEKRNAIIEGKSLYRILTVAGRPHKLQLISLSSLVAEPEIIADHRCGMATANNSRPVEAVPVATQAPACDVWRASGWSAPTTCPRIGVDAHTGLLFGDIKAPISCKTCEPPPFEEKTSWNASAVNAARISAGVTPRPSYAANNASGLGGTAPTEQTDELLRPLGITHASSVPHRRSRPYINRVCSKCHNMIGTDINVVGVQIGERWVWVQHDDDCEGRERR